jgi:antitoxin component of MazEF toxin-antitoxin module
MIKTLTTHGNSLALVIEKPILQLLNIRAETPLSITTNGRNIVVTPVKGSIKKSRTAQGRGEVMKQS